MDLIDTICAEFTFPAGAPNPFDTCPITKLPLMLHIVTDGHYDTGSLVTCYPLCLRGHVDATIVPAAMDEGAVGAKESCPARR